MPPLYVVQQNAKLRIHNRRLQVELEGEALASLPLSQVSQVVLFGNIGLTTPAIDALLAQNSEVVFLTQRGEYRGRLIGAETPHVPLRRAQYARLSQADFVLSLAKSFVVAKLSHQRALLLRENPLFSFHRNSSGDEVIGLNRAEFDERVSCLFLN